MSTVVCQGLQPCIEFESHLVEATTMRLKLVAPKSLELESNRGHSKADIREKCHKADDLGGWSFLQSLSPQIPKKGIESETPPYVHPLVKNLSPLRLSDKSLELCTESLGSETGSDTSESSIFLLSSLESMNGNTTPPSPREEEIRSLIPPMESRKPPMISRSFPPPLTSMTGSNSLQVRPHREGGRLIIQAMESPSTNTYFQAERSHGRLRLSFWKNAESDSEEICEEDEVGEVENYQSDEGEVEEQEDEEGNNIGEYVKRDMEGNCFDVEVGIGMEKFPMPSRCKEDGPGDKGLCNWEAFWVATS